MVVSKDGQCHKAAAGIRHDPQPSGQKHGVDIVACNLQTHTKTSGKFQVDQANIGQGEQNSTPPGYDIHQKVHMVTDIFPHIRLTSQWLDTA